MFGLGTGELIVILIVAFLLFGPKKLPEIAHSIGTLIRKFKEETNKISNEIKPPSTPPPTPPSTKPE